jgi:copper resistance protein D
MTQLIDTFGYLSVILRGFTLAFQSLVIGGVVFILFVIEPVRFRFESDLDASRRSCQRLVAGSAIALAITQLLLLLLDSVVLMGTTDMRFSEVTGANFLTAGVGIVISAVTIALLCGSDSNRAVPMIPLLAIFILASSVATSHAAARLEHRFGLTVITALHQLAVSAWIGGLPYLVVSLRSPLSDSVARLLSRRFSRLAIVGVVVLAVAGILLSTNYIDSINGIYGTAYGVMVVSKVALFVMLIALGAVNFYIVREARTNAASLSSRLRRFAQAEIGIGFTVIFAAASLTSQPPATDMTFARVSAPEIAERMTPRWPRLSSPSSADLSVPALQTPIGTVAAGNTQPQSYVPGALVPVHPNTPADLAWSEYNHHWAGVILILMGLLALIARTWRATWARNWPLLFGALAFFLFLRADPESWPLGLNSFWVSFADSEVMQHRIFVGLIVALAVFEWKVQTGNAVSKHLSRVFPLACAIGGALLLTHSHSLGNVKEELLAELSHVPIALLGVLAGWSRWLELQMSGKDPRIPSLIWPICFVLIGVLLLNYRES